MRCWPSLGGAAFAAQAEADDLPSSLAIPDFSWRLAANPNVVRQPYSFLSLNLNLLPSNHPASPCR